MRILIATDGSRDVLPEIRAAIRLLSKADRQVDLLYVAARPRALALGKRSAATHARLVAPQANHVLEEGKWMLAEDGIDAEGRYRIGSPAPIILDEAGKYDVTVIGAKGRDTPGNVGLGPVASRIVEHASGCVLAARELQHDQGARILAPVDGSDGSKQALAALSSMFDLASAEITLLHVVETEWLGIKPEVEERPEATETDPEEASLLLELQREGEQILSEAHARLLEQHPGITTLLREGNPANEILSEAEQGEYDLVLLGASGSTDLKHRILGSVSSKVAWTAPCAVFLARVRE